MLAYEDDLSILKPMKYLFQSILYLFSMEAELGVGNS